MSQRTRLSQSMRWRMKQDGGMRVADLSLTALLTTDRDNEVFR